MSLESSGTLPVPDIATATPTPAAFDRTSEDQYEAADVVASNRRLVRIASTIGVIVGAIPFLSVLWDFGFSPLRTAEARGFASNFYDVQGRALLDGHLAVPDGSLGLEGFVLEGRTYMYFPPFPALLRLPVMLFTDRFDGRLTVLSMIVAWLVLAVSSVALMWRVRALLRGDAAISVWESATFAVLLASITGGSVVVYLGALPWVFHEAYLWSIAFTIATLASILEVITRPRWSMILLAGGGALGANLTRTTAGWPMAFLLIGVGIWLILTHTTFRSRADGRLLVAIGTVPILVGSSINWMKFRHPFMIPLKTQLWTGENPHRRLAIMLNDGSLAGPQFLRTSFANYLRPDGIRFVPYFPFITLPAQPARSHGGAFLDMVYRTGSAPAFMPLLVVLTLWAGFLLFRRRASPGVVSLRLPLLGAAAVGGSVMVWGYLAFRYVSEFMPVLVIGSAVGMTELARRFGHRSSRTKGAVLSVCVVVAVFGMAANVAVGFTASRTQSGGDRLIQYVSAQLAISDHTGHPLERIVHQSDELPATSPADELHIVGNCDGLYMSTGEIYIPWVAVELRDLSVVVEADTSGFAASTLRVFSIGGIRQLHVSVETNGDNQVRLVTNEGIFSLPTPWYSLDPGERVEVSMIADPAREVFKLRLTDRYDGLMRLGEWRSGYGTFVMSSVMVDLASEQRQDVAGLTLTAAPGGAPPLCRRLLDRVG